MMKNAKKIIADFPKANILVVGDLILDEYIWGDAERLSPEAPVPVVWAKKRTFVPGGAANVANNIRALDGNVRLVGVIGKDKNTPHFLAELKKRKISCEGILAEPGRPTTVKTRIIAGHQQMLRLDWERCEALPRALNDKIIGFVKKNIKGLDAIIIEDYGKGVVNKELLEQLVGLARSHKMIITVDPKEDHFRYYRGATAITPNRREVENAIRHLKIKDTTNSFKINTDRIFDDADLINAGRQILKYLNLDSALVTLGEQGMRLFEKSGKITHIPTVAQAVFDVSGAGDTVISVFTLSLCAGASKLEAALMANFAAGIVVGKVGTATITRKELIDRIER
ncbi:MAG: D-glycero-beta-D-manno-heptose-7-phosphate kinase [Candidatus Omnitrophica bacterium]|jgi:D-beta-D-heptose 7-phosphate kinase/D-beta-D-heptose 1-phosphate adenosyltransferase|nr:D-glycero-beta-D-manno-heptose-7-phosphate kinase [Candidatus Omnitrophota bacterium]